MQRPRNGAPVDLDAERPARSAAADDMAGRTPGTPGNGESSEPCTIESRLPCSGSSASCDGSHGASPTTVVTASSPAILDRDRATHREAEQQHLARPAFLRLRERSLAVLDATLGNRRQDFVR